MLSVSPELAAAIEAKERAVSVRLSVDWDGDGHGPADSLDDLSGKVAGVDIDRSLTTDLPDAVRVVEGSSVAQLKADLVKGDTSDERKHAAWYFSRSNAGSALAGKERLARETYCDLVFQTSAGPQSVRRFTGRTRRLPVSAGNRTAQLEALDYRELLRNPVTLVPVSGRESGADGTWVVTQALHACGFYAGPAPRASGSVIWAPMYGSLAGIIPADPLPQVSGVDGPDGSYRPTFVAGPFVLAADAYFNSASDFRKPGLNWLDDTTTWTGLRGRWEQWVKGVTSPTSGPAGGSGRHLVLLDNGAIGAIMGIQHDGKLFFKTFNGAATVHSYVSTLTVPSDGAWHAVGINWDQATQQIIFKLDATTQTVATALAASEFPPLFTLNVVGYAPFSDVHIHRDLAAATSWLADTVSPTAVIDPSLLQLEAVYGGNPQEAWALLDELAGAEQAVSGFDEAGIYRYRTRKRLVNTTGQTVQRTLTADTSILDLDIDDGIDRIRNIVEVSVTPVSVTEVFGPIYTDRQQRTVPATSSLEIVVSFQNQALSVDDAVTVFPPAADQSYVTVTINSDGTPDSGEAVNATTSHVASWTSTTARVVVNNFDTVPIYITELGLAGIAAVVGTPTTIEARNDASVTQFGPQPLPLSASKWIQRFDVAQNLATLLLGELKDPHPVISNLGIIGDPRLQLGDRARIKDSDGVVLDGEYWLTKIADSVSESGGYTQQLAARQASTVLRWGVGRWGVDVWGSG